MVEFDLTEREFPELEVDSFEELEELPDLEESPPTPPAPVHRSAEPPTPPPSAMPAGGWAPPAPTVAAPVVPSVLELPLPQSPLLLLSRMAVAFIAALLLTMFVILVPWFAIVVPQIDGAREARRAQNRATPQVVVAAPVVAPVAPVVAPIPLPPDILGPTDPPEVDASEPVEPALVDAAVAVSKSPSTTKPSAVSSRRSRGKPRSTVVRSRKPAPSEPPPVAAVVVPTPEIKKPEPVKPPAPKPQAPARDRALGGGMKGSVGHASLSFRVRVLAGGVLSATVVRDGVSHLARGTYSMSGNEASFQLRESGGGAAYSGKLGAGGASGRATLPDGSKERFKVKR